MELNDLLRLLVGLLALISLGAVAWVGFALIRSFRRRAVRSDKPRGTAESIPASSVATAERIPPVPAARMPQPPVLPELISEAADTPRDERLIDAAASTMKTLPEGVQDAVWIAVVSRQFNAALLAALRPDWGARATDVYERLERLWFVSAVPDGSCVQSVIRHAMLRHLFRNDNQREYYLRHS